MWGEGRGVKEEGGLGRGAGSQQELRQAQVLGGGAEQVALIQPKERKWETAALGSALWGLEWLYMLADSPPSCVKKRATDRGASQGTSSGGCFCSVRFGFLNSSG